MSLPILFQGNWVDVIFLCFALYFILTNNGFIAGFIEICGLILTFFLSLHLYPLPAFILENYFHLNKGIANTIGWIIMWVVIEIIFFILIQFLIRKIPKQILHSKWNGILGIIPALLQAYLLFAFLITAITALPLRGNIKKDVLSSRTGPYFVTATHRFESSFRSVFNDALAESLNFVTIKEESNEKLDLGFTLNQNQITVDPQAEEKMLQFVNDERNQRGLAALIPSESLQQAARAYGVILFSNGFFAHQSVVDNSTPADRLDKRNIEYSVMGENLAYAPDVNIAHTGLMNSPGHRANILSPEFHTVGIGIVNGGIYGEIFVQEFTD